MSMKISLTKATGTTTVFGTKRENDLDPNYEFDVGLQGVRLFMNRKVSQQASVVDMDLGLQVEKNLRLRNTPTSTKAFANFVYQRELARASSLIFENELKLVKDRIPDETWYYAGFLGRQDERLYRFPAGNPENGERGRPAILLC